MSVEVDGSAVSRVDFIFIVDGSQYRAVFESIVVSRGVELIPEGDYLVTVAAPKLRMREVDAGIDEANYDFGVGDSAIRRIGSVYFFFTVGAGIV